MLRAFVKPNLLIELGVAAAVLSAVLTFLAIQTLLSATSTEKWVELPATVIESVDSSAPHVVARTSTRGDFEVYDLRGGLPREGEVIQLEVSADSTYARELGAMISPLEWMIEAAAAVSLLALAVLLTRLGRNRRLAAS